MALTQKVIRGTALITAAEIANQLCSLARNVVLARVLTKADFGTAALLGLGVSVFELGGRLSIEHCLIQARDGDDPRFISSAHFLQVALGCASGLMILGAAAPMAAFFGVEEATWALQVLASLPLMRSLMHLDVYRRQREMRFDAVVWIELIPNLLITAAVWPLASIWQTYTVLVWLLVGKQATVTIASHLAADRPYRWDWDPAHIHAMLRFGWPMLVNGLLLFGIMQGDRFAVGLDHSVEELGTYSIAGAVALMPAAMLLKLGNSLLLPTFADARDAPAKLTNRIAMATEMLALLSAAYGVVLIVASEPLVRLIFGSKYAGAGVLAGWLGAAQALRLLRCVPTNAALSRGDSRNLLHSNVLRLSGLVLAFLVAGSGGSLVAIAACAMLGEVVALVGSLSRYTRDHGVPLRLCVPSIALAVGVIGLAAGLAWSGLPIAHPWWAMVVALVLIAAVAALHLMVFSRTREWLTRTLLPLVRAKISTPA